MISLNRRIGVSPAGFYYQAVDFDAAQKGRHRPPFGQAPNAGSTTRRRCRPVQHHSTMSLQSSRKRGRKDADRLRRGQPLMPVDSGGTEPGDHAPCQDAPTPDAAPARSYSWVPAIGEASERQRVHAHCPLDRLVEIPVGRRGPAAQAAPMPAGAEMQQTPAALRVDELSLRKREREREREIEREREREMLAALRVEAGRIRVRERRTRGRVYKGDKSCANPRPGPSLCPPGPARAFDHPAQAELTLARRPHWRQAH
jgi:hypothetical protein